MPRVRFQWLAAVVLIPFALLAIKSDRLFAHSVRGTQCGSLNIVNDRGEAVGQCPLKHTSVHASISGPVARVIVKQQFRNDSSQRIEAVYAFPMPHDAAIDSMTMRVGARTIKGLIKKRGEARQIYENARNRGDLAGLLDQERPNVFTQSVANIQPNEAIEAEISYVQLVPFEEGRYEFRFPMVVGPRYIPGNATGHQGGGWAPDTDQVPDASRITPNVTPQGTRAGHDISLSVDLDAGVPLDDLRSTSHQINIQRISAHQASIQLADLKTIPNKDFILTYDVTGKTLADAVLAHADQRGGYLTLLLTPPARPKLSQITPKELVFVLDTSGSMSGFPIEKAKETMREALSKLNPKDTFNLITFSGDTHILFPTPVPATAENLAVAQEFLASRHGGGGTEMMKTIRAALAPSDSEDHLRITCFMTDGYVGNDFEILGEVRKHPNARVFAFGIGNAVNHYLLDRIAAYGNGEVQYVGLQDDGSAAARRFSERIRSPILTNIHVDWDGLDVRDIYPQRIPDVFAAKPVSISARYGKPGHALVRIMGVQGAVPFVREIPITLPARATDHDELATLWARRKVEDLMACDLSGLQRGAPDAEMANQITQLGLDYRLVTQFTSFVAVEERTVTDHGQPKRVDVPVEMPDGVSYQGVFGDAPPSKSKLATFSGVTTFSGTNSFTGGVVAGVLREQQTVVKPVPPPVPRLGQPQAVDHLESVKLESTLARIAAKLRNGEMLAPGEQKLIHNGKIRIIVQVRNRGILTNLRDLGFREDQTRSQSLALVGEIPVLQLSQLAQVEGVIFVSPTWPRP